MNAEMAETSLSQRQHTAWSWNEEQYPPTHVEREELEASKLEVP
jgi:hypothetical protein